MDSLAAVDWTAYEQVARAAIDGAHTDAGLEDARVRHLGRKSQLVQALRGVRDRESGMLLNGIRARLEEAVEARRRELAALAVRAASDADVDVTLPGTPVPRGRLHLLTQVRREIEDIFLGLGYEVWDGAEVCDRLGELRRAQHRPRPSVALEARHVLPRRRHDPADADLARPDPGDA